MSRRFRSALARSAARPSASALADTRRTFQSGRAMRYVVRPLLMALMVTALASGVVAIIRSVVGDPRWSWLLLLFFLLTLEGIYTTNWLQHPAQLPLDRSAYRAAEVILLTVLVRIFTWVVFSEGWPSRDLLIGVFRNPAPLFLDAQFLVALGIALIMWRLGTVLSQLFYELEVSEFELNYYSLPLAERKANSDDQPIRLGRNELVRYFARYWLWGGIFLAATTAFSHLDLFALRTSLLAPLATGRAALDAGALIALMAYFLIGLWLLSHARLLEMDARWLVNGAKKDDQVRHTWQRMSLALLLGIAFIAAFLPIGSTSTLSQIVSVLLNGILLLANLLVFLITLPFALILALLSRNADFTPSPTPPNPLETIQQQQVDFAPISETVTLVLSSAFWALLIVGVGVALLFFIRERRQRAEGEQLNQLWAQFVAWLTVMWASLRGRLTSISLPKRSVKQVTEVPVETPRSWRRRFRRIGSLPPREQIRAIYLMTVQRAAEAGVTREPTETPVEFEQDLREQWPQAENELESLTVAFLKARYSSAPIEAEELPHVAKSWHAVRREMQRRNQVTSDNAGEGENAS